MNSERLMTLGAVALLLAGSLFVGYAFYAKRMGSPANQDPEIIEALRVLESEETAAEDKVLRALLLVTRHGHPIGKRKCIAFLHDPSVALAIRQGAGMGITRYTDSEAQKVIEEILGGPEIEVKVRILEGLGETYTEERMSLLRDYLNRAGLSERERLVVLSSILRASKNHPSPLGDQAMGEVIAGATDPRSPVREPMFMNLLNMAPKDDRVVRMILDEIQKDQNPLFVATGIKHLAAIGHPLVKENLLRFIQNKDPQVRAAAVHVMQFVCPADRWTILGTLIQAEADSFVLATLVNVVKALNEPGGRELLRTLVSMHKLDAQMTDEAQRASMQRLPHRGPCK